MNFNEKLQQLTLSEVQQVYTNRTKVEDRISINDSNKIADVFRWFYEINNFQIELKEYFVAAYVNRANHVLHLEAISVGSNIGTVIDKKQIFRGALMAAASSILICHNHPSGKDKPSVQDITATRDLKEGAKILDLVLLDHLIITSENYYSFADNGAL